MHDYIRAEQPSKTINRVVSTSVAIVLHMRRVRSKFARKTNGTEVRIVREIVSRAFFTLLTDFSYLQSVNLSNWSKQATENFYKRLRKYDLIEVTLPYRGISAMQEYEQCVNTLFEQSVFLKSVFILLQPSHITTDVTKSAVLS